MGLGRSHILPPSQTEGCSVRFCAPRVNDLAAEIWTSQLRPLFLLPITPIKGIEIPWLVPPPHHDPNILHRHSIPQTPRSISVAMGASQSRASSPSGNRRRFDRMSNDLGQHFIGSSTTLVDNDYDNLKRSPTYEIVHRQPVHSGYSDAKDGLGDFLPKKDPNLLGLGARGISSPFGQPSSFFSAPPPSYEDSARQERLLRAPR